MFAIPKKILLIISIIMGLISGFLYQKVNWVNVFEGKNLMKELHLATLFFCLGLYYIYAYVVQHKKESKSN
ncbi:hypothetical protein TXIAM_370093 [Tenacibaculum xiamenense]